MGLFNRHKLGSRVLRLGARGPDVAQMQDLLGKLGYHIGAKEDFFGYLTQDALQQFQRDYGLIVDGAAGQEVYTLLLQEQLPIYRRVHVVQPSETIEQIAASYGVGVEAFAESNKIRSIYPGQRLIFFDREVWGITTGRITSERDLTGVIYRVEYSEDQEVKPPCPNIPVCVPAVDVQTDDPLLWVHNQIRSFKRRRAVTDRILDLAKGGNGVYLPWASVSRVDGGRYLTVLHRIKKRLPEENRLFVELAPTVRKRNILGGVDYAALNKTADRLVISLPIPSQSEPFFTKARVEQLLWPMLRHVSSWKVLLKIPVFAVQWNVASPDASYTVLPYSEAMSEVFRRGARLEQDSDGSLFYRYYYKGDEYHLRIPHRRAFNLILAMINRYNLAGVMLDQLGMEDPRLWEVLRSHFRTARF